MSTDSLRAPGDLSQNPLAILSQALSASLQHPHHAAAFAKAATTVEGKVPTLCNIATSIAVAVPSLILHCSSTRFREGKRESTLKTTLW